MSTHNQIFSKRQFGYFLVVGFLSSLASLSSRIAFNVVVPFEVAVVWAHIVGLVVAFSLNKIFVFPDAVQLVAFQFGKFLIVNMVSLTIATIMSSFAFRIILPWLEMNLYSAIIAHFIGLAACAIPSFLAHKYFSFR